MNIDQHSIVIITGASRGIGREAALAFARKGAKVILASRDLSKMNAVADEIKSLGGHSMIVPTDVSNEADCKALVATTIKTYGKVDVLVNNAGYGHYASVENLKNEDLDAIFKTNLYGAIWCIQAALPHMKAQKRGHIVNVSTIISKRSVPFMSAYCMSKFAMTGMDEALRLEVRPYGIGVSLVCPGITHTDFQTNAGKIGFAPPVANTGGMTAKKVGQTILSAVEHRRRRVYLTFSGKALVYIQRLCPAIVDEIIFMMYSRQGLNSKNT